MNSNNASTPPEAPPMGPVLSAPHMEDVIHELRADLDTARKRISDLGDEKARLQGLYAGALNRIQELGLELANVRRLYDRDNQTSGRMIWVLGQERDALREGLEECIESFRLIIVNRVGDGRCDGRCEGCSECVARKALASAQALLGKGELCFICHKQKGQGNDRCSGHYSGTSTDPSLTEAPKDHRDHWIRTTLAQLASIKALAVDPESGNEIALKCDEAIYAAEVLLETAGQKAIPSPTERPIQAGDTVRHKTKGWEKTVKRILPALPEKSLAVMALFDGGDRYPLSELERVEPAKVKP